MPNEIKPALGPVNSPEAGPKSKLLKAGSILASTALLASGLGSKVASAESSQTPEGKTEIIFGAMEDEILTESETQADDIAAKLAEAGFDMVKVSVPWTYPAQCSEVNTDTKRVQNGFGAAKKYGLDVAIVPISSYTNKEGRLVIGQAPISPSQIRCYSDTIVSYMANFAEINPGGHLTVMPYNEPNLPLFLKPQFDKDDNWIAPKITARILAEYPKFKDEAAKLGITINIVGPELSSGRNALEFYELLKEAKKDIGYSGKLFDQVSIHPYGKEPDEPPTKKHPEGDVVGLADYEVLRSTIDEIYGLERDIWYTEYGVISDSRNPKVPGLTEAEQAEFYKKALSMAYCQKVGAFVLFNVKDDETGIWTSGLWDENGEPKPAYEAVKQTIADAKSDNITC